MSIAVDLIPPNLPVLVDDRTATLGGSFYYKPLRPYSVPPLEWCYEQLKRYPKATLLDVGASTGCYSLLAKHHADLQVYAFEPVPLTWEVLSANIKLNDLEDRVVAARMAVSNHTGVGDMNVVIADGGKGVSIFEGTPAYHKVVEQVRTHVTTLDSFCESWDIHPTFIKIDTEGGEKYVLEGAEETILKYKPFILCEYSPENVGQYGYNPTDIIRLLESWGYVWSNPEGSDLWCVPMGWESVDRS